MANWFYENSMSHASASKGGNDKSNRKKGWEEAEYNRRHNENIPHSPSPLNRIAEEARAYAASHPSTANRIKDEVTAYNNANPKGMNRIIRDANRNTDASLRNAYRHPNNGMSKGGLNYIKERNVARDPYAGMNGSSSNNNIAKPKNTVKKPMSPSLADRMNSRRNSTHSKKDYKHGLSGKAEPMYKHYYTQFTSYLDSGDPDKIKLVYNAYQAANKMHPDYDWSSPQTPVTKELMAGRAAIDAWRVYSSSKRPNR